MGLGFRDFVFRSWGLGFRASHPRALALLRVGVTG